MQCDGSKVIISFSSGRLLAFMRVCVDSPGSRLHLLRALEIYGRGHQWQENLSGTANSVRPSSAFHQRFYDWRLLRIPHAACRLSSIDSSSRGFSLTFEPCFQGSCCRGQNLDAAVQSITDCLYDSFFANMTNVVPSETRWYTYSPALASVGGLALCHNILARVWEQAFSERRAMDPGDEDAFHGHCHKKVLSSLDTVQSSDFLTSLGLSLVAQPPCDCSALPKAEGSPRSGPS